MTVGVAGLILGGGFGSFSKAYGLAGGEPIGGGSRDRRRRRQNRQRLHESRSLLGAERRRRRVRNRHPRHSAHAPAAGIFGRRLRDHKGVVRRGLPAPHRQNHRILRASALQSTLGRAVRLRPGRRSVDLRWSSRASTSSRPRRCGVRSSTGSRRPRRISPSYRRRGSSASRRAVSGTPPFSSKLQASSSPTTVPARRPTTSSGPATSTKRAAVWHAYQSAWLPQSLLARQSARTTGRRAVRGGEASRRLAAFQQGARGRDRGGDRRGPGYGDESGGRRRVRARDQRRRRTARLSRTFQATSRTRPPRGARPRP